MKYLNIFLSLVFGASLYANLTFEQRVETQKKIEKVYYEKRIWPKENPNPKPPFEEVITEEVLKKKVEDYLIKSTALEEFWNHPLTGEELQAEIDRMVKQTKDPETLKAIFSALNNDPFLIAECLARPNLAEKLINTYYAYDKRFHKEKLEEIEEIYKNINIRKFNPANSNFYRKVHIRSGNCEEIGTDIDCFNSEEFEKISLKFPSLGISEIKETPEAFIIYITENKTSNELKGGLIYVQKQTISKFLSNYNFDLNIDPPECKYKLPLINNPNLASQSPSTPDSWEQLWYLPEGRELHLAVWTGSEMIVWGGKDAFVIFRTGGRYIPSLDFWFPISTKNAPSLRENATAVWTGQEMIIWGGYWNFTALNTGARYNPSLDKWTPMSTNNAPAGRYNHTAVWTGMEMIIWGGAGSSALLKSGAKYVPSLDDGTSIPWIAITETDAPSQRENHTAVWTGTEMIIWGGNDTANNLKSGGRYNPSSNSWVSIDETDTDAPSERRYHTALWIGSGMAIWGGENGTNVLNTGAIYRPTRPDDYWIPITTTDAPIPRSNHTAVWTGEKMIIWGGKGLPGALNTGGRYNPLTNSWQATTTSDAPSERYNHTAVWSGSEMIIWGGSSSGVSVNTGGRYNPYNNTWVTMQNYAISSRKFHTSIWTGAEMIVWGGSDGINYLNTGARFTPATGIWVATETGNNVPSPRENHTAVWNGLEMIIWGGYGCSNPPDCNVISFLNTGGYYKPYDNNNPWGSLNSTQAPYPRAGHTALWIGNKMIVWGGYNSTSRFNTGGILENDNWTDTSITDPDTPSARTWHTAVWTGTEMIIWGGANGTTYYKDGAKYDPTKPADEAWTKLSDFPETERANHTAVWTGKEMVVWGGQTQEGSNTIYLNDGAYYNYQNDYWLDMPLASLDPRSRHSAVWTGNGMIVWGGLNSTGPLNTGAHWIRKITEWGETEFRPPVLISMENAPTPRYSHPAVWTGQEMIVWDGVPMSQAGGMYYPNTPPTAIPLLSKSESSYSSSFHTPACNTIESFCDSTNSSRWLLIGRDGVVEEPNTPNTLDYETCTDGTGNVCDFNKSIDRIKIRTENGTKFTAGSKVIVEVTVVASSHYMNEYLDIYYTSDAFSPSWVYKATLKPIISGEQVLSTSFYLASGVAGYQAIRANFRYEVTPPGTPNPCSGGSYDDHDDLVFMVGSDFSAPTFTLGMSQLLYLDGSSSKSGSNPDAAIPNEDQYDGFTSQEKYEWDLNQDAGFDNEEGCSGAEPMGVDRIGSKPEPLTEESLSAFGINKPGAYPIWLRVTDKAGLKSCSSTMLAVEDGTMPTVKLLSPNGGETWKYSPSETNPIDNLIVWQGQDNDQLSSYKVSYSANGGGTFTTIYESKKTQEKSHLPEGLPIADCSGQPGNCTPGVTNSVLNIPFNEIILDLNVKINLTHTRDSDLEIILIGPDNTQVTLSYRNGGEGQNYIDTVFDDQAKVPITSGQAPFTGNFIPQYGNSLSIFNYSMSKGNWTLRVLDHGTGGSGVLHSWSVSFTFAYDNSFLWTMPTKEAAANSEPPQILPSATCRVEVEVCDVAGNCSSDVSDSNFYIVQPTTSSIKTMILWNSKRIKDKYGMSSELESKLQELANHLKVTGTIKDLSQVSEIDDAYTCWDDCYDGNGCGNDPPCEEASSNPQERANKVAQEIWNYLYNPTDGQISKVYTNVQNIILVGDDYQIPFYRIQDGTIIYPESTYPTEVGIDTSNTIGSAINSGFFLTDNFYSEYSPENSGLPHPHDKIYQNDFGIGRLVETPFEIEYLINTFIGQDGQLNVTTSQNKVLISGFTFVYDSATKIKRKYINASKSIDCLMDDPVSRDEITNCSPPITDPETNFEYSPWDLYDQLFISNPHSISSIMTHANHFSFAVPKPYMGSNDKCLCTDRTYDLTNCAMMSMANTNYDLAGTILYTSGCHSGLPIPDDSEDYVLDLPQVMARQKVVGYIGNTGYGWAILDGIGLTEKLMELLTDEFLDNPSITIGRALSEAKRKYFLEEKRYDVFDEKVMHELTLYGIPNYLIVTSNARSSSDEKLPTPSGPDSGCANGICLEKKFNTTNTFGEVPENVTELLLNFTFGEGTHKLVTVKNTDGTLKGHYYTLNGIASGETGDSIQPKFIYDSYLSGTEPHGVVFTGGSYSLKGPLSGNFIPISAVPKSTNDPSTGAGPLPSGSTFVPGLKASTGTEISSGLRAIEEKNYLNMVVHTGYYEEGSTKDNIYDKMQFAVYYHKDSNDFTPPIITAPGQVSYNSTDTPIAIPDNDPNGAISTINVLGSGITSIKDINVKININHTSDNNLTIYLIGPDLTQVTLCALRGGMEDNFTDTLFDDDATLSISSGVAPFTGTFKPESSLSAFQGKTANGSWKLKVVDSVSGDTGSIVSWQITFNEKFHTLSGMVASFGVKASDESDIYRVLITYDDKYKKQWKSVDLVKNEFTGVWEGELTLKGNIRYYIQAVDKAGNVGQLKEYGQDQNSNGQKYGSTWEYSKLFTITLLDSDSDTMPDAYEEVHTCLNKNLNDALIDFDYDYLSNLKEFEYDTDPCKGDSDGGGDNDGSEKNNGRNPLAYPDDKHLTIMVTKNGNNYTIDWNDSYGQNNLIDGYYFVYRSDTPFFDPTDKISPTPIPNGTISYIDSNPPCSVCYYNVWNYQIDTQPPVVEAVIPSTGSTAGGTSVKIYGENFQSGAKVYFDNILGTSIVFVNESQINCKTPAHSAGAVDVKVVNPNGQDGIITNGFTYY